MTATDTDSGTDTGSDTSAAAAPGAAGAPSGKTSVLRSGALMAAGSIVSRATGFIRSAVVVAALGTGLLGGGEPPPANWTAPSETTRQPGGAQTPGGTRHAQ
ncbi:hypothetical protein ACFV4Q_28835, partial [Streptomyces nojiriensis]